MSRASGRLSAFARSVVVCLVLGGSVAMGINPAPAAAQSSGGNVTVTAVVAPARYILVDNHDRIRQIISNSPDVVTPTVYKHSFKSTPIPLTPHILGQYNA